MRIPTPPTSALLLPVLVVLAGCGGGDDAAPPATVEQPPSLAAPVAERLATRSDAVAERLAAGDACGAAEQADALQAAAIEAVNAGQVPGRYQEELIARATELVDAVNCPPPAEAPPAETAPVETATAEAPEQPAPPGGKAKGHDKRKKKHPKGKKP